MTGSIDQQWGRVIITVQCAYMPANNEVEGLALSQEDKPQTLNCVTDWRSLSLGSVNKITKNDLQLMCLKKSQAQSLTGANKLYIFNGKSRYFRTSKYDVIITSPVANNV